MAIDPTFLSGVRQEEARTNYTNSLSNFDFWNRKVLADALRDSQSGMDVSGVLGDFERMVADQNQMASIAGYSPISATNYSNYNALLTQLGRSPQTAAPTPAAPRDDASQTAQQPNTVQNAPGNIPIEDFQIRPGETIDQYNQRLNQARGTQAPASTPTIPVSNYTGPSVVDYLNSIGQPSDRASRAILAQNMGIQNYSGTAEQNTQLLNALRSGQIQANPAVNTSSAPPVMSGAPSTAPSIQVDGQVLQSYGLSLPDSSQSPMKSFADTYKELLSNMGVPDIKKEFDKVQKEYDNLQNELNDKISEVNDNPWYSEGVRVKEIRKLQDKYEGKTSILTDKLKLYNSLYEQGIDEAKFVAQQAYNQYQFETGVQLKLYDIAQKQLESSRDFAEQVRQFNVAQANRGGGEPAPIGTANPGDQLSFLRTTLQKANELASASGKGLFDRVAGWVKGSSSYKQLENLTNTLATNVLTLATDPGIRKFFGPQMSEADVRLMLSSGTTLNPESQTPDQLRNELLRLDALFQKLQGFASYQGGSGTVVTSPTGEVIILTD